MGFLRFIKRAILIDWLYHEFFGRADSDSYARHDDMSDRWLGDGDDYCDHDTFGSDDVFDDDDW